MSVAFMSSASLVDSFLMPRRCFSSNDLCDSLQFSNSSLGAKVLAVAKELSLASTEQGWSIQPRSSKGIKRSQSEQTLYKATLNVLDTFASGSGGETSSPVSPLQLCSRCPSLCCSEEDGCSMADCSSSHFTSSSRQTSGSSCFADTGSYQCSYLQIPEDTEHEESLCIAGAASQLLIQQSRTLVCSYSDPGPQAGQGCVKDVGLPFGPDSPTCATLFKKSKSCVLLGFEPAKQEKTVPKVPSWCAMESDCAARQHSIGSLSLDLDRSDGEELSRKNTSTYLSQGPAAVELFFRLNHARQTLDFAKRQASLFASLDKAELTIWDALSTLNELREYEAALFGGDDLSPDMTLLEHAHQTAELCRLRYPDDDWLHLVGLIHSLGKLLAHPRFGSQPQWAVCGEIFPLGCRFDPHVTCSQFFSVNPDRRKRAYNTQLGLYEAGCSLANVYMSWSACEYLYLVLMLNQTLLPDSALFLIRHQKFHALLKPGNAYRALLSPQDEEHLGLLEDFQVITQYKRREMPAGTLTGQAFHDYYNSLIAKYIGTDKLFW